jgi:hypothetical protein
MGGIDPTPPPSSASDMSGVEPSAPPMPTEEQAAVNNPTAVEEPVLFAQNPPQQQEIQPEPEPQQQQPILERIPSEAFLQRRFDESGQGE